MRGLDREAIKRSAGRLTAYCGVGTILIGCAIWLRHTYWPNLDSVESRLRSDISRDLPPGSNLKSVESFMSREQIPFSSGTEQLSFLDGETAKFTPRGATSFQSADSPTTRHFPYGVVQYQEVVTVIFWFDKKDRLVGSFLSQDDVDYAPFEDEDVTPPKWAIWLTWKLLNS